MGADSAALRGFYVQEEPGSRQPTGPWQEMAEAANGTPLWTPSGVFNTGDIVLHYGNLYEARWRNRNVEPTGSGPWRLLE